MEKEKLAKHKNPLTNIIKAKKIIEDKENKTKEGNIFLLFFLYLYNMEIKKITLEEAIHSHFIILIENELLTIPNDYELGKYVREKMNNKINKVKEIGND